MPKDKGSLMLYQRCAQEKRRHNHRCGISSARNGDNATVPLGKPFNIRYNVNKVKDSQSQQTARAYDIHRTYSISRLFPWRQHPCVISVI